jgi:hypothetical protein
VFVSLPHAFVDAGGASALAAALVQEVVQPVGGEDDTLYEVLKFEHSPAGFVTSQRSIEYLVAIARRASDLGLDSTPTRQGRTDASAIRGSGKWLAHALKSLYPRSRLSRAAALLSLILIYYRQFFGLERVWTAIRAANRSSAAEASFVGLAARLGWLIEGADLDDTFDQMVRRVGAALAECSQHSRCDPEAAGVALDALGVNCMPVLYVNYWEDGTVDRMMQPQYGLGSSDLKPTLFETLLLPSGQWELEVNAYLAGPIATLVLKYDCSRFVRADVDRLVSFLGATLATVTQNPHVHIADLMELP